jgi:hypothetical protein
VTWIPKLLVGVTWVNPLGTILPNDVSSGGEVGESVNAIGAGGNFRIAGLEDAGVVQVDVKDDAGYAGIVGDVEDGAGDRGEHDGSMPPWSPKLALVTACPVVSVT